MTDKIWIWEEQSVSRQRWVLWELSGEIVTHIVIPPPVYVGPGESGMWALCNIFPFSPPLPLPFSIICIDWPQLSSTTATTSATAKQPHPCQGLPGQYLLLCVINSVTSISVSTVHSMIMSRTQLLSCWEQCSVLSCWAVECFEMIFLLMPSQSGWR